MRYRLWVSLAIVLGCTGPQPSADIVPAVPVVEPSVEVAAAPPPAEPAPKSSDAPVLRKPQKSCGPEPQVCCCLPRDSVECWKCSPWNHPAPAEMLESCIHQCKAGHREACFRAALSFKGIAGVKPNKMRAEALLRRACELKLPIACLE